MYPQHSFATFATTKAKSMVNHKCNILFPYFQLEFYATRLISSDSWVHGHPYWDENLGHNVAPRRCSPSSKCRPCILCTHPKAEVSIFPTLNRPPGELDVHGALPSQELQSVPPHKATSALNCQSKGSQGDRLPMMPPPAGGMICQSGDLPLRA